MSDEVGPARWLLPIVSQNPGTLQPLSLAHLAARLLRQAPDSHKGRVAYQAQDPIRMGLCMLPPSLPALPCLCRCRRPQPAYAAGPEAGLLADYQSHLQVSKIDGSSAQIQGLWLCSHRSVACTHQDQPKSRSNDRSPLKFHFTDHRRPRANAHVRQNHWECHTFLKCWPSKLGSAAFTNKLMLIAQALHMLG